MDLQLAPKATSEAGARVTPTGQFAKMQLAQVLSSHLASLAKALVIGSPENGKLPTHRPNLLKAASPLMSPVISDDTKAQRQRSDSTVSEKE
ncbi:hypothetical protein T265_03863 [Opisthorchis viverrini]|uniref:Uncharacterized protein n=1 Tax=Opisthorchis viverrini TaxID=6198 RepID=A0A074ZQ72_OPIVI|nr:hypothetical protein T265_03863 [Opisthorchis viverrini]KER29568.1 hypothetical protein T265_03863 [Opisthorchis viverrini]